MECSGVLQALSVATDGVIPVVAINSQQDLLGAKGTEKI